MARTVTLGAVRDRARVLCDMVGSLFCTDAEFNGFLDAAYTELVDLLCKGEIHQFETSATITTAGSTATYAVPADHYKTLAVEYQWQTGKYVAVEEVSFAERNRDSNLLLTNQFGSYAAGYRVVGNNVVFTSIPPNGQVYRHLYVPASATLVGAADATTINGVDGWDEFMVLQAAIRARMKEEAPTGDLEKRVLEIRARIAEQSQDREPVKQLADYCDEDGGWYAPNLTRRGYHW